ncbi:MAG: hypothetical protein R3C71_01225 [Candidatus Krumholzibacteriia bacterium]|nr:hypothetical protein [bacterium]MCB9515114.1 hypothetical protein [Candidatus Latescibacterota bacterium]
MRALLIAATAVLLAGALVPDGPTSAREILDNDTVGAARDSLWQEGHNYRQWIYDQNFIGDDNANLDPEISFLADGRVRTHPSRVYFYDDLDVAFRKAKDTGLPLAFYIFDHTCSDCLFVLPQLYRIPEVVEASKDFVNCYVELPRQRREAMDAGLMTSSLTVQFFLPGGRRLRVVTSPDDEKLLKSYADIKAYVADLAEDELYQEPRRMSTSRSGY